jgi:hypothetical protein
MEKLEQRRAVIMAEVEKEVTTFLTKVAEGAVQGVALEMEARAVGLRCGARMVEQGVQMNGKGAQGRKLACQCAEPGMGFVRYERVRVTSVCGEIEVVTAYYHCSGCGQSRWPVLEAVGWAGSELTEGARRLVAHAGAIIGGFGQSGEILHRLSGWRVSDSTLRRVTEAMGVEMEQQQKEELKQAWHAPETVPVKRAVPVLHVAVDGTTVRTERGPKREVKSGVVYETKKSPRGEPRAVRPSYVSTFDHAHDFGHEVWLEAVRRGARTADVVVTLGDGSVWIWNLYAENFPGFRRVEILDFFHVSEYIAQVAQARWGEGTPHAQRWYRKQRTILLQEHGAVRLWRTLKRLKAPNPTAREAMARTLHYVESNLSRMNYYEYRQRGSHIGSGLAEAACKHLVGARLKQSGMTNWRVRGAEAVLRVRVVMENGTFDRYADTLLAQRFKKAA